jgi:protein-disulfide isomerase
MLPRSFIRRLLGLLVLASSLAAADAAYDPRLGEPFTVRERPSLGSDKASIVVVEFGSYKCSHCEEFQQRVFPVLNEQYVKTGQVQWFMVPSSDNPADPSSRIFAIGRCLHRQGKFWDNLEFLMTVSNKPPSFLNDLVAKNAAIDAEELNVCLQQRETRMIVAKDFEEFLALKIQGTPTFVIRKRKADGTHAEAIVRGMQPAEYFQKIFDDLAKVP